VPFCEGKHDGKTEEKRRKWGGNQLFLKKSSAKETTEFPKITEDFRGRPERCFDQLKCY